MPLLPLLARDDRAFLEAVLRLNLQLDQTRGATVGLDAAQAVIVCRHLQPLEGVDVPCFSRAMIDFKDTADRLRDRIAGLRHEIGANTASRPALDEGAMLRIAG